MKAVVMSGGFGTRIQPLTNSIPKPMLPVMNRPMMEHIIRKLKKIGIDDIIVLLYFKPEIIKNYFGDGSRFGVKITYVLPDADYGTAGAVKCAQKYLDDDFIIVSGDLVTDFDFSKIIEYHLQRSAKITITLTSVENPLQFGVVITDHKGRIKKFLEKPGWGEVFSDTINTGIYVLKPEILDFIPENISFDFSKDLFPRLMQEQMILWGYTAKGYWRDVGNPQSYLTAAMDILHNNVEFEFEGERKKFGSGYVYVGKNTKLPEDITIEGNVVIGDSVRIGKNCFLKDCVIDNKTAISDSVHMDSSVVWKRANIEKQSYINNAIICNDTTIGENVQIEYGAVVAEHCNIGSSSVFEKEVTIWPNKTIEEASIISRNVIWTDKYKHSIFEGGIVHGRSNIELSCEIATKLAEGFASILPVGSYVYIARDYNKASRMIKRAFSGGLLSCGINVLDLKLSPCCLMKHKTATTNDAVAGVYFKQSTKKPDEVEIVFFDNDGLPINTNTEKNCERIYFKETFRRVDPKAIGEITEMYNAEYAYTKSLLSLFDVGYIQSKKISVAANLLFGVSSLVYPDILTSFSDNNIIINAHFDRKKRSQIMKLLDNSRKETAIIVKSLGMSVGFILPPGENQLSMVANDGRILKDYESLLVILNLLNKTAKNRINVYLSVSAPDIIDARLENLIIERGKIRNLPLEKLKKYDFIADTNGHYIFNVPGFRYDAMFNSIKIVELMANVDEAISDIVNTLPNFYFNHDIIPCDASRKGLLMRKFSELAMNKRASFEEGVKIYTQAGWVIMLPDQYANSVHLYTESAEEASGIQQTQIYKKYIKDWLDGK